MMARNAVAGIALWLCVAVQAADVGLDVKMAGETTSAALEPGKTHELRLRLDVKVGEGFKINEQAPLTFNAKPGPGATVSRVAQGQSRTEATIQFKVAEAAESASFNVTAVVPVCNEKAQVCLLKQTRWAVQVSKGVVTAQEQPGGESALTEGKLRLGEKAPVEGCAATDVAGKDLSLNQVIGKKPVVLLTYRAHW